jgi:nucleoid-associated protein EbfC
MTESIDTEREIARLMAEMQENQRRLEDVRSQLLAAEIVGSAERGLVTVTMTGGGRITAVEIDQDAPRAFPPPALGEVVLAAITDAMRQHAELTRERFGPLMDDPSMLDDALTYYKPDDRKHTRA